MRFAAPANVAPALAAEGFGHTVLGDPAPDATKAVMGKGDATTGDAVFEVASQELFYGIQARTVLADLRAADRAGSRGWLAGARLADHRTCDAMAITVPGPIPATVTVETFARSVEASCAGIAVRDGTAEALSAGLQKVLTEPASRAAARRIAEEIAPRSSIDAAADALADMVMQGEG